MSYSPVEIRHVRFRRSLLGYRRAVVDRTLGEIADSYEAVWQERMDLTDRVHDLSHEVARHREVEELLRTTLMTAERAVAGRPRGREASGGRDPGRGTSRGTDDHRRGASGARAPARLRPACAHVPGCRARRRRRRRRRHTRGACPGGPPGGVVVTSPLQGPGGAPGPCLYLVADGPADYAPPDPCVARSPHDRARRPTRRRLEGPRRGAPRARTRERRPARLLAERAAALPAELTLVPDHGARDKVVELRGLGAEEADRRLGGTA